MFVAERPALRAPHSQHLWPRQLPDIVAQRGSQEQRLAATTAIMLHGTRRNEVIRQETLLLAAFLFLLGNGVVLTRVQEDSIVFEDDQQILTRLSENLSMEEISLRSFQCRERLTITESSSKGQSPGRREFLNHYQVKRQPNREVATRATFQEMRTWGESPQGIEPGALGDLPTLENPFTGAINQMFDFENRFATDFHKERQEVIDGNNCEVLRFETVPELAGQQIHIVGAVVSLRQRGFVWVSVNDNRLLRVFGKQIKLPKGCRNYEFQIDYHPQTLFGKKLNLPAHTQLKIELKDKHFIIEQEYSDFEEIH